MARSVRPLRIVVAVVVVVLVALGLSACVADPPPRIGTATPGNAQAVVSWQPPLAAPAPIAAYVVTPWIGYTRQTPVVFNSTATTQTVAGLTNGVTYTFTVHAVNVHGDDSAESTMSNPVTLPPMPGLYGWGANNAGQLGDGSVTARLTPNQVNTATDWASVAAGYDHTVAVKSGGTLWAWGYNWAGQLGIGIVDGDAHSSPVQIGTATTWASVAAGTAWTMAVKTDGTLWTWGNNWAGQLGDGTTTDHSSPVQVGTGTNWAKVAAGYGHTMAIKTNGTLWAWGDNENGQLGIGTVDADAHSSPVQIGTATNWASVSPGWDHTVAVKTDGTLWTWGYNVYGQLGDGTTNDHYAPVQLDAATNWASTAAAYEYTMAVKTDGTLWAWGLNEFGQLGVGSGTGTFSLSPVRVGTVSDWATVSAGNEHTMAIKIDGTLWGWGTDDSGELGDGTTGPDQFTPIQVGLGHQWVKVFAGSFYTMGLAAS